MQMSYYSYDTNNIQKMSMPEQYQTVIDRITKREKLYLLIHKLYAVAKIRGLRLIIENPATQPHYLLFSQNFVKPTFIDTNRTRRGDYFVKPTAYWFVNCEMTYGFSIQNDKAKRLVLNCRRGEGNGLCSEERSMLSPDYARNFICDFILGKTQPTSLQTLFDL